MTGGTSNLARLAIKWRAAAAKLESSDRQLQAVADTLLECAEELESAVRGPGLLRPPASSGYPTKSLTRPELYADEHLVKTIPAGPGLEVDLIETLDAQTSRLVIRHMELIRDPRAEIMLAATMAPALVQAITAGAIDLCIRGGIANADGADETV